jgi:hypothetical protein
MGVPGWVIGVVLSFGGCTLSNAGVNLQKLCHTKLSALRHNSVDAVEADGGKTPEGPKYFTQPLWIGGLLCIGIGSAMDLVSFAFAPLSLLAPLGAMVRRDSCQPLCSSKCRAR